VAIEADPRPPIPQTMIRILYIGDVVGQPGRRALHQKLEHVIDREKIDFTIVNIENAAGGFGVTEAIMDELSVLPINAYTSGNHIWDKKDFVDNYDHYEHVVRPANYPAGNPGKGSVVRQTAAGIDVAVLQVMGNVFMPPCDNPFYTADRELKNFGTVKVIIVDIHCEATSEKQAMGRHLDGRVSAVLGTHTHVPTADERILPNGTAFQTDVGMTGAYDSVIGFRPDEVLHRFLMNTPRKLEVAKRDIRLAGAMIEVDEITGRASSIVRIHEKVEE
jgi:2',3'-cyclic-nucleotide 2'-phosphodiesterase